MWSSWMKFVDAFRMIAAAEAAGQKVIACEHNEKGQYRVKI